ncbi:biotin carboxylase [Paralcaligenes sp. KSB-10]|uniref:acetyl-CoA carboxylase biotin carboxylase subunit n=1 Tax=Paralcaligenes sp. KSB-10 TaxID=2901142 RepID=UPI001E2F5AB3|nr:biotin carboxylase N-terminal domain-containing protein [Paralcaligenes sp. KSB-10]UHL63147.1 biotin carboxylase [Paralcaligenes sp. KSB-10]
MFKKVVIANRGAIASRLLRALHEMGIKTVAVYSEADASLPYLAQADEAWCIGAPPPAASYLDQEALINVIQRLGADGLHPGYGFLAENPDFARRVTEAGARFIGPSEAWIRRMGHKTRARDYMISHGLPSLSSSSLLSSGLNELTTAAEAIGFPIMVKPASGGGGIGMFRADNPAELLQACTRAKSLANRSFGSSEIYLERYLEKPRHIEFQILGDRHGNVCHLYERDCSIQRRHQKIIEESPAPGISRERVSRYGNLLAGIFSRMGYDNIGTVETLYEPDTGFNFLEMNTRLQVEHAVTEETTGIDIVKAQVALAFGESLESLLRDGVSQKGHTIEARICAEDPYTFLPSTGTLRALAFPTNAGVRVETGFSVGSTITPYYDSMIAKLIVHGDTRDAAIELMIRSLNETVVDGVKSNIPFLRHVIDSPQFRAGAVHTGLVEELKKTSWKKPVGICPASQTGEQAHVTI